MRATPIPIGIAVQQAVCAPTCTLPPELRHLLMVLAVLADRNTGRGTSGQDRIAQAMGVKTTRSVRRLLVELAGRADSPATVRRRPRMHGDGRGRTSDEYQLRLADQADIGVQVDTHDQPDARDRVDAATNRTPDADQPDVESTTNRTPTSRDPVADPVADPVTTSPRETAPSPKPPRASKARDYQSDPRVLTLRDFYVERYKAANQGSDPAFSRQSWGRAMRAFVDLLDAAKSEERARLCIERTFSSADAFTRRRCQPWEIAADANKLLALAGPAKTWVQHGGGERDLEDACRRGAERFGGAL